MPRATKDSRIASDATGALASGNCSASERSVIDFMRLTLPGNDWLTMSEANRNYWRRKYAEHFCHGKLPDPTPEQTKCSHSKWRAMKPQPRHCVECGLLMWDAGD